LGEILTDNINQIKKSPAHLKYCNYSYLGLGHIKQIEKALVISLRGLPGMKLKHFHF
jgi:hypothetical protein